jgi:protein-tyrosine phosphatase
MPPARTQDDDVIDPYRRDRAVYEESASQLIPAVDEVARVLRAALL